MSDFLAKLAEVFRSDEYEKTHPFTSAVVLCAGSGTRFSSDGSVTKQNVLVAGVPVAVRSILAFEENRFVDEIVAVCRADEIAGFCGLLPAGGGAAGTTGAASMTVDHISLMRSDRGKYGMIYTEI